MADLFLALCETEFIQKLIKDREVWTIQYHLRYWFNYSAENIRIREKITRGMDAPYVSADQTFFLLIALVTHVQWNIYDSDFNAFSAHTSHPF